MSWNDLDQDLQAVAEEVLTEKQLAAWKLELAGLGLRAISLHLDLSRAAVRDRLDSAYRALRRAGITQDGSGRWHL